MIFSHSKRPERTLRALFAWKDLIRRFGHGGLGRGAFVKGRVGEVDVFVVHLVLAQAQTLAEALEVDDLTLPEEADDVVHVGVVGQPENVVIGLSGLLFCCDLVRTTCCFSSRDTF